MFGMQHNLQFFSAACFTITFRTLRCYAPQYLLHFEIVCCDSKGSEECKRSPAAISACKTFHRDRFDGRRRLDPVFHSQGWFTGRSSVTLGCWACRVFFIDLSTWIRDDRFGIGFLSYARRLAALVRLLNSNGVSRAIRTPNASRARTRNFNPENPAISSAFLTIASLIPTFSKSLIQLSRGIIIYTLLCIES